MEQLRRVEDEMAEQVPNTTLHPRLVTCMLVFLHLFLQPTYPPPAPHTLPVCTSPCHPPTTQPSAPCHPPTQRIPPAPLCLPASLPVGYLAGCTDG